jgi:hypothetical protein
MSEHLFDLLLVCILLTCFVMWLLNRKTVKWLIRQWLRAHYGYHALRRHRHHWPWLSLPVFAWWLLGAMPPWVTLVRLITVTSLVTFYRLYRKRQKVNIPKQRGLLHIPMKEQKDETGNRQTDQTREQETSEREEPASCGEPLTPEIVEDEGINEPVRPEPILPRHRVRRKRQDQFSEPMD